MFIITNERLNYCLEYGKKYNVESWMISYTDVLSGDKLNDYTSYSFINEDFFIYF